MDRYYFQFFSADESVAFVEGVLQNPNPSGSSAITGIGLGDTSVRVGRKGDWPWLRIHVVCAMEPAVIAANRSSPRSRVRRFLFKQLPR